MDDNDISSPSQNYLPTYLPTYLGTLPATFWYDMMPLTKTEPKQNPQPYIRQSKNEESEWPKKKGKETCKYIPKQIETTRSRKQIHTPSRTQTHKIDK